MVTTFYEVLGVPTDADADEISSAYRDRVKEYHPDVSDHPDASERFKRIRRAHDVLSDPVERRRYDRLGHTAYCESARYDHGRDSRSQDDRSGGPDRHGRSAGRRGGRGGRRREEQSRSTRDRQRGHSAADTATGGATNTGGSRGRTGGGFDPGRYGGRDGASTTDTGPGTGRAGAATSRSRPTGGMQRGRFDPRRISDRVAGTGAGPLTRTAINWGLFPLLLLYETGRLGGRAVLDWVGSYDRNPWLLTLNSFGSGRILERRQAMTLGGVAMYPFAIMLWWTVDNVVTAPQPLADPTTSVPLAAFVLAVVLISGIPNVGLLFFSSWGIVLPVLVSQQPGLGLQSTTGYAVIAACWLPFLHSILVLELIRRDRGGMI